eukprot:c1247_g1_i1.p1 GENE.c1247_g1_i1~~c1247_g1_i1.p1  ORF type:complete len:586 (-),score=116.39 c1247_g1_i1:183-1940(-)
MITTTTISTPTTLAPTNLHHHYHSSNVVAFGAALGLGMGMSIAMIAINIRRTRQQQDDNDDDDDSDNDNYVNGAVVKSANPKVYDGMKEWSADMCPAVKICRHQEDQDDTTEWMPLFSSEEPQLAVPHPTQSSVRTLASHNNIVLVTVGLPGRGKSTVSNILARYLQFFHGVDVRFFNVSAYRRAYVARTRQSQKMWDASLFDPNNDEAKQIIQTVNETALNDLMLFLGMHRGRIAVFDAPNVTRERRAWVRAFLAKINARIIFIEFVSTQAHIAPEHVTVDEYVQCGVVPSEVTTDKLTDAYLKRLDHYERVYQPLDYTFDESLPFIKLIERGKRVVVNNIEGYMQGKIVQFLMNCAHQTPKPLYLTRHGQSRNNQQGRIGGDAPLTELGVKYSKALAEFAEMHVCKNEAGQVVPARLWTSTLKRTKQTTQFIPHPTIVTETGKVWGQMVPREWNNLDEIYAGVCDGMTYAEIETYFKNEARERARDKLGYRYPKGESYLDVIQRLEPCIHEIERYKEPLLICSHQGVLRMIYAFYKGVPREHATNIEIKLNHVYKLTPTTFGCTEEIYKLLDEDPGDDKQKKL